MADFDEVDVYTFTAATFTVQSNVAHSSYLAALAAAEDMRDHARERATHRPGPYYRSGHLWKNIYAEVETGASGRADATSDATNFGVVGLAAINHDDIYTAVVGVDLNVVPYARRLELGFYGPDSLGREYHQHPYPYLLPPDAIGAMARIKQLLDPPLRKGAPGNGPPFPPQAPQTQPVRSPGLLKAWLEGALASLAFTAVFAKVIPAVKGFVGAVSRPAVGDISRVFRGASVRGEKIVARAEKAQRVRPARQARTPKVRVRAEAAAPLARRVTATSAGPARARAAQSRPARAAAKAKRSAVVARREAVRAPSRVAKGATRVAHAPARAVRAPRAAAPRATSKAARPAQVRAGARNRAALVQAAGRARTGRSSKSAVVARSRMPAKVTARVNTRVAGPARKGTPSTVRAGGKTRAPQIRDYFKGVGRPARIPGADYSEKGWNRAPVERVRITNAHATQNWLSRSGVDRYYARPGAAGSPKYPLVVLRENRTYVMDGHHRVTAALRRGETHITARVQRPGGGTGRRPSDFGKLSARAEARRPTPPKGATGKGTTPKTGGRKGATGKPAAPRTPAKTPAKAPSKRDLPTRKDLAPKSPTGRGKVVRSSKVEYGRESYPRPKVERAAKPPKPVTNGKVVRSTKTDYPRGTRGKTTAKPPTQGRRKTSPPKPPPRRGGPEPRRIERRPAPTRPTGPVLERGRVVRSTKPEQGGTRRPAARRAPTRPPGRPAPSRPAGPGGATRSTSATRKAKATTAPKRGAGRGNSTRPTGRPSGRAGTRPGKGGRESVRKPSPPKPATKPQPRKPAGRTPPTRPTGRPARGAPKRPNRPAGRTTSGKPKRGTGARPTPKLQIKSRPVKVKQPLGRTSASARRVPPGGRLERASVRRAQTSRITSAQLRRSGGRAPTYKPVQFSASARRNASPFKATHKAPPKPAANNIQFRYTSRARSKFF
uniref:hypothetical protein n=1 Tax=Pseudonocardia sp. CA-138482 TaxID=3240023 RepID=UPI003F49A1D9